MEKGNTPEQLEAAREHQEQLEYEAKLIKKTTWTNRAERRRHGAVCHVQDVLIPIVNGG